MELFKASVQALSVASRGERLFSGPLGGAPIAGGQGALAAQPNMSRVMLASGPMIYVWDTASRVIVQQLQTGIGQQVSCLAVSSNGNMLVAASNGGNVLLWSLAGQDPVSQPGLLLATLRNVTRTVPQSVALSADGSVVAAAIGTTVQVWQLHVDVPPPGSGWWVQPQRAWQLTQTLYGHEAMVTQVQLSQDGVSVTSGACDGTVRIW